MSSKIISFLKELKKNNDREWFKANKDKYDEARAEFVTMVEYLIRALSSFNPAIKNLEPKDAIFRIYRDVRFSKDKSPYKTQMGAYMAPGGRKSPYAGYYIHIEPGNSFIAGGSYCPPNDILKKIRSEIFFNVDEFKKLIDNNKFKELFQEIQGSKLVRPPVGFPKDFEDIDLLKFKDYTIFNPVDDSTVCDSGFPDKAIKVFKAMNPFNDFLNRAID